MTGAPRRLAVGALALVAVGSVLTLGEAFAVMTGDLDRQSMAESRVGFEFLRCLQRKVAALPDVPTYVEPIYEGLPAIGYQRLVQYGFDELTLVERPEDAEQVVTIVAVPIGDDTCIDHDLLVERP